MSCGKMRFASFGEARQALIDAAFKRVRRPETKRKEKRLYYCEQCEGWHLTARSHPDPWRTAITEAARKGAKQ